MAPGATQLTVTPRSAYSRESSLAALVDRGAQHRGERQVGLGLADRRRGDQDDPAEAALGHPGQRQPGQPQRSEQQQLGGRLPLRRPSTSRMRPGGGPPALRTRTSSAAPTVLDLVDRCLRRVGVGQVGDDRLDLVRRRPRAPSRRASSAAASRPVIATRWPAAASASAVARPMPDEPPPTSAVLVVMAASVRSALEFANEWSRSAGPLSRRRVPLDVPRMPPWPRRVPPSGTARAGSTGPPRSSTPSTPRTASSPWPSWSAAAGCRGRRRTAPPRR